MKILLLCILITLASCWPSSRITMFLGTNKALIVNNSETRLNKQTLLELYNREAPPNQSDSIFTLPKLKLNTMFGELWEIQVYAQDPDRRWFLVDRFDQGGKPKKLLRIDKIASKVHIAVQDSTTAIYTYEWVSIGKNPFVKKEWKRISVKSYNDIARF